MSFGGRRFVAAVFGWRAVLARRQPEGLREDQGRRIGIDRIGRCIHICTMSHTLSVRVPDELADWLEAAAKRMGLSRGELVREQLEKARHETTDAQPFMSLAGTVSLDPKLSARKGFAKK